MTGENGRRCRSHQIVAVLSLLCCLAPSLNCFSWQRLRKQAKQNKVLSEATVMEGRIGSILFNGTEINFQSGSPFVAATGDDELLHVDLAQSDGTGLSEQTSQQKGAMVNEAAWRHLNPSLHCGQNQMKLKAMGPGAANLQLDTGNAHSLPLIQVPEPCGYSMRQNALGLVLVIPYDGCYVMQENGKYVLPMSWMETPVKLTCPISPHPDATPTSPDATPTSPDAMPTSTTAKPAQQPSNMYNPSNLYSSWYWYYYNMYMMTMTPAPNTPTTTTTTAKPDTKIPQIKPPAYPYYYYPYYPYYPYFPFQNLPVNTAPPATATPKPTTTTTTRPCNTSPTTTPTKTTTTTTTTTTVSTTKACSSTTKPSSNYPGQMSGTVPYNQLPFTPYVTYEANRAGKIPEDQKYVPRGGYKSGLQARAHRLPSFNYWQHNPWFLHATGQDHPQFDRKYLQPEK